MMGRGIVRRVAELEAQRKPPGSYVVRLPPEAEGDPDARLAAIMGHRSRTGWMGPVVLLPPELTKDEWLARYGHGQAET